MRVVGTAARVFGLVAVLAGIGVAAGEAAAEVSYGPFGDPQPVHIEGDPASAEEPFLSSDGHYLLFNSSEEEPNFRLQYATLSGAQTFDFQGEILGEGVNVAGSLSGAPSLDDDGNLYFVSAPRSYFETLSTIYTGSFFGGSVTGVHLVEGVSGARPGLVDFDPGVSPDGHTLYVSVGEFTGGAAPASASLVAYERDPDGSFSVAPNSASELNAVNQTGKLVYGAAVTSNELEFFFTAASPNQGSEPAIYRSIRANTSEPFIDVEKIAAIIPFAEAPSISTDGTTLYYHEKVGSEVHIMDVTRERFGASAKVERVKPAKGPAAGGTPLRIYGANLGTVTGVEVGGAAASEVHVVSSTEVTAVTPPGTSGQASVAVVTDEGSSPPSPKPFKYASPTITSLSPSSGTRSGGTPVTLTGTGFATGMGHTSVDFGKGVAGGVECASTTTCTAIAPPAAKAGQAKVRAIVNGAKSKPSTFTYVNP